MVSHHIRFDEDLIQEQISVGTTMLLETDNKKDTKTTTVTKLYHLFVR